MKVFSRGESDSGFEFIPAKAGLFQPIRQVFKVSRRLRKGEASPARSSLCTARQRLGSEPLVELFRLVVKPMATEQTPGAFYRGMRNQWLIHFGRLFVFRHRNSEEPFRTNTPRVRKVGIDGTVLDVPIAMCTTIWAALREVAAKDRWFFGNFSG